MIAAPATTWITGLPAAGKTTLALALAERLGAAGMDVDVIDGDVLRQGQSRDLGFTPADRGAQATRASERAVGFVTRGGFAVVALVSPYRRDRLAARQAHDEAGLGFLEVWLDTPLAECQARDPKGLYARARAGELSGLTGVDAPYEPPEGAELVIRPDRSPAQAAEQVADALGLNPRP